MTRVVVRSLGAAAKAKTKAKMKRVYRDGQLVNVATVDANSPRFAYDLQLAFASNVRKARKANKAAFGELDIAPTKR